MTPFTGGKSMSKRTFELAAAGALALSIVACQTAQPANSGGGGTTAGTDAGATTGTGTTTDTGTTTGTGTTGTGTTVPTLVSVNLQNVLNNLSVALSVDKANIPVNAQVPIDVAANVCGVSVNVLAASVASGHGSCTATTTSPTLIQSVQQQLSAGSGTQTTNNLM
jgi:hypothetical protein